MLQARYLASLYTTECQRVQFSAQIDHPPSVNLLTGTLSLQNRSKSLERSCGLPLRDTADKRTAC